MNALTFTVPGTIEVARSLTRLLGPLVCAGDDPNDPPGILAAQANYDIRLSGWCQGHDRPDLDAYYRDQTTGAHGWMCCRCRRTTQTG